MPTTFGVWPRRRRCRVDFAHGSFESLEARTLFSVPLGADGWHAWHQSGDTRVVYVSSSLGWDGNDGLSPAHPVRSLARAKTLVRDGKPDWLLLKRGDVFNEGFGKWTASGRSADEPILIGAYGPGGKRPLLKTGTTEGLVTYGNSGHPVNYLAITSLQFVADKYDGTNGGFNTSAIRLLRQGTDITVEDVLVKGYKDNIQLDADGTGISNFTIRRSQVLDAYNLGTVGNGHAQGLYAAGSTKNLHIEQCLFDHNGWREGVPGGEPNWFNHNIYINKGATGTVVYQNVSSRAAMHGISARGGGEIHDNLLIQNPVAILVMNAKANVTGNVILNGCDMGTLGSGVGINAVNTNDVRVVGNIIAHSISAGTAGQSGVHLNSDVSGATVWSNTVYDWSRGVLNEGSAKISVRYNELTELKDRAPLIDQKKPASPGLFDYEQNTYSSPRAKMNRIAGSDSTLKQWAAAADETGAQSGEPDYVDPSRSLASFDATTGGPGTFAHWIFGARNMNARSWDWSYTSGEPVQYVREGFSHAGATAQALPHARTSPAAPAGNWFSTTQLGPALPIGTDTSTELL